MSNLLSALRRDFTGGDHGSLFATMDWVTLRFAEPEREARFSRSHMMAAVPTIRLFMLFGISLYAIFGVLDALVAPTAYREIWAIRYLGVCTSLGFLLASTFAESFIRHAQYILTLETLIAGGGILAMLAVIPAPANQLYYAGLILVVIFCSNLIRLHHLNALATSVIFFAIYQWIALWENPIPRVVLLSDDFFLAMAAAIGLFSSYVQEIYVRQNFLNLEMLAEEKAEAERLQVAAEAANKAKSDFLAVVGHELRTPLNAIIGFSDIMQQEMLGPVGTNRYVTYSKDIFDSGNHLLDVINGILDLSKAEAGKLLVEEEEVHLGETADQCIRVFRHIAANRNIKLSMPGADEQPVIRADTRLCKQILFNLVSNAIKFTKPGGTVVVTFPNRPDGALGICVEDTGIGIAPEDLPRIIEPFVQVDSSLSREFSGTGLGLTLVKRIVELHGGNLDIASELGKGTTVCTWFPPRRIIRL